MLLFLTPRGDTTGFHVHTKLFIFFSPQCFKYKPGCKNKLRTDCATCCILSEEGEGPSAQMCWHFRGSWGSRTAGCFSLNEDPPVTSLCFLCVCVCVCVCVCAFVSWLCPLCCWYGWGFTVTPHPPREEDETVSLFFNIPAASAKCSHSELDGSTACWDELRSYTEMWVWVWMNESRPFLWRNTAENKLIGCVCVWVCVWGECVWGRTDDYCIK